MSAITAKILMYGGAAGIVIFSVLGAFVWVRLRKKGKKLTELINDEYR